MSKLKINLDNMREIAISSHPTLPHPSPPHPHHPTNDPALPEHTDTLSEVRDLIDKLDEFMENLMTDYHKAWNKREQLHKLYIRLKEED